MPWKRWKKIWKLSTAEKSVQINLHRCNADSGSHCIHSPLYIEFNEFLIIFSNSWSDHTNIRSYKIRDDWTTNIDWKNAINKMVNDRFRKAIGQWLKVQSEITLRTNTCFRLKEVFAYTMSNTHTHTKTLKHIVLFIALTQSKMWYWMSVALSTLSTYTYSKLQWSKRVSRFDIVIIQMDECMLEWANTFVPSATQFL